MTPQERKIFVQALEALEREARGYAVHDELQIPRSMRDAIVAIKKVLAQQEQEPVVGTKTWFEDGKVVTQYLYPSDIYTTPPQPEQEPVTYTGNGTAGQETDVRPTGFFFQADKPEQEPVAYIQHHKAGDNLVWDDPAGKRTPLYTTPPQRKPLTDEQIEALWDNTLSEDVGITALRKITRAIEAAHGIKE